MSDLQKPGRRFRKGFFGATVLLVSCLLAGCEKPDPNRVQGYVEGEYVYVAAPSAGQLDSLKVERGQQVKAGDALFALDSIPERAARDEAERRLIQARANLEDIKKGRRPEEIASIKAQLQQAHAALVLSEKELERQQQLLRTGAAAKQEFDRARSTRDQDRQRVAQLEADLETAQLGARSDQIEAAEANVRALEAALTRAEWESAQKSQVAPQAGIVFDTLYRQGEWVSAGKPIVALLPPANVKVRAFVPEDRIGALKIGDRITVKVDGVSDSFTGTVNYISPQAEYTPPVIYSRESRGKLVFMVEAFFDPAVGARLHPGQPVDVEIGAK